MILPNKCHICKDPIRLYQPYYTVRTNKTIGGIKTNWSDLTILCPSCFNAYKDFITERTVQENHKKTMQEMKGAPKNER